MGNQKAKANLNKAIKAMETRISKLKEKEKPKEQHNKPLKQGCKCYAFISPN